MTEVGCGLAGYDARSIAPLFKNALDNPNIMLSMSFKEVLEG